VGSSSSSSSSSSSRSSSISLPPSVSRMAIQLWRANVPSELQW